MGVIKFILIFLLVFYLLGFIGRLLFRMWIGKIQRDIQQQAGGNPRGGFYRQYTWGGNNRQTRQEQQEPEGEIRVTDKGTQHKKINEKIGDYIDYEEVK